jgi:hypothetical protein
MTMSMADAVRIMEKANGPVVDNMTKIIEYLTERHVSGKRAGGNPIDYCI